MIDTDDGSGANLTQEEKDWATFVHLAALAGMTAIPLGWIVGPLVLWLLKKDKYPLVDEQGKEALNFQITVSVVVVVLAILGGIFWILPPLGLLVYSVIFGGSYIVRTIMTIIATIATNRDGEYHYPFSFRFLS